MKIYRNHYSKEGGCSGGFSFHSSKRDALLAVKEWKASDEKPLSIAEPMTIQMTKRGVIRFLNIHGGHPDNG